MPHCVWIVPPLIRTLLVNMSQGNSDSSDICSQEGTGAFMPQDYPCVNESLQAFVCTLFGTLLLPFGAREYPLVRPLILRLEFEEWLWCCTISLLHGENSGIS